MLNLFSSATNPVQTLSLVEIGVYLAFVLVIFLLLTLVKRLILKRSTERHKVETRRTLILHFVIKKWLVLAFLIPIAYFGTFIVSLPQQYRQAVEIVFLSAFFLSLAMMGLSLIGYTRTLFATKLEPQNGMAVHLLFAAIKVLLWSFVLFLALDNMGIDVTALLAGLGISGIAIALAAQAILGDLFNFIVIQFDKPIKLGDFISIDSISGTVERIGIKTTKIRGLQGELTIISNSDITSSRVKNYQKMEERRVAFPFTLSYSSDKTQILKVPELVKDLMSDNGLVRFDRCHLVALSELGYRFEVVYFLANPDFIFHLDTQQTILFTLADLLSDRGLKLQIFSPYVASQ